MNKRESAAINIERAIAEHMRNLPKYDRRRVVLTVVVNAETMCDLKNLKWSQWSLHRIGSDRYPRHTLRGCGVYVDNCQAEDFRIVVG